LPPDAGEQKLMFFFNPGKKFRVVKVAVIGANRGSLTGLRQVTDEPSVGFWASEKRTRRPVVCGGFSRLERSWFAGFGDVWKNSSEQTVCADFC